MVSDATAVSVEFTPAEYERLTDLADDPAGWLREAATRRLRLDEAIAYTRERNFAGPEGFAKLLDDETPTWPFGALAGLEAEAIGDGSSRWAMDAGPEHANPMGTVHGGVICDLGDAAMGTAYMSTLGDGESFTTVDLTANFLRPVRTGRLEAVGRVVHRGGTVGLVECDVSDADGNLVSRLSSTCLTLRGERARDR